MKMLLVVLVLMLGMSIYWIWLMIQPIRAKASCPSGFLCNDIGTDVKCNSESFENYTGNKIGTLSHNELPYVKMLGARSCNILNIESKTFSELTQLEIVDISENEIPELKEDTFYGLTRLKDLDIRRCQIFVVDQRAFSGLTRLVTLSLSYNNIQDLKPYTFKDLKEMKSLFLDHNNIETLDAHIFFGLTKLEMLKLSENQINRMSPNVLKFLPALTTFDISGNVNLDVMDDDLFGRNPNLKELQLSRCNIRSIAFKNLPNLERIEMRENKLNSVTFMNVTALRYIDLSFNKLGNLSSDMFRDMPVLSKLYVDENSIPCDCEFYETLMWFVNRSVDTGWSEYSPVCDTSAGVPGNDEISGLGQNLSTETPDYGNLPESEVWWKVCSEGNTSAEAMFIQGSHVYFEDALGTFITYRNYGEPVVNTIVFIFGTVGNAFILAAVIVNKNMRTVPNMYVVNLAVIDLISLILVLPVEQVDWIYRLRISSNNMCKFLTFFRRLSLAVSAYSVSALSIQRFIVTANPLHANSRAQPSLSKTGAIIFAVWTTAAIFSLPATIASEATIEMCGIQDTMYSHKVVLFELISFCILPLSLIVFTYILTALNLVKSGQTMKEHPQAKARNKIAKMVLGLTFVFLISYVPYHIIWTYVAVVGYRTDIEVWYMYLVFSVLLVVNPCFNPVALFCTGGQFRKEFSRFMCCKVAKD
ncbi:uncharacterized protein [Periplaneta americana]